MQRIPSALFVLVLLTKLEGMLIQQKKCNHSIGEGPKGNLTKFQTVRRNKCLGCRLQSSPTMNSYQEYLKLKARVEYLQRSQRNLLGEDLGQLSTKELEQLEHQLEMSLKQIRSAKSQFMLDQLCDLKRKEQMLQEANRALRMKLQEDEPEIPLQLSWPGSGSGRNGSGPSERQPQSDIFFQPLPCDPSLQTGYSQVCIEQQLNTGSSSHDVNGFIPGWM